MIVREQFTGAPARVFNNENGGGPSDYAYTDYSVDPVTDLIVKPWSVNEWNDGVSSVGPAIRRTEQLIEAGRRNGVNVIVEYLWGGNGLDTSAPINSVLAPWMEDLRSSGVPVADIRDVMNRTGIPPQALRDEYRTVNSGGSFVDATHLNEAGQEAAANALFAIRSSIGLG